MDKTTTFLIFLQLLGWILGITALFYASLTYDHDINWNKILTKQAVFPVVRGEKYFNMKTLQIDWIETKNKTEMLSVAEIHLALLRETSVFALFIAGIVIVNFMVLVHFCWNAYDRFKHFLGHMIVWLNAICGLLLFGLALILKLSNIEATTYEMMKLLQKIRSNPSDVDIRIDELNDHPGFNLLKRILTICLKQKVNKQTFFKIPGYDFSYEIDALTELGFCPHFTIKFGTALGVGVQATIMWIVAFTVQMFICNESEIANMNQVGPTKQTGDEVFGGVSYGFGNIADMRMYQLNFIKDKDDTDRDKVDNDNRSRRRSRRSMVRQPYSAHFFSRPISSIHFPAGIPDFTSSQSSINTSFHQSLAEMRNKLADKFAPELQHLSQPDIQVNFKKTKNNSLKIDDSVSSIHFQESLAPMNYKLTDETSPEPSERKLQPDTTIMFKKTRDNSLKNDDSALSASTIHENFPPMSNKLNDEISPEPQTKKRSKKKKKKSDPIKD